MYCVKHPRQVPLSRIHGTNNVIMAIFTVNCTAGVGKVYLELISWSRNTKECGNNTFQLQLAVRLNQIYPVRGVQKISSIPEHSVTTPEHLHF